jgi:hypothetical protein
MKQVVFLAGVLLILVGICCKPKAQPRKEELPRAAAAPSQQPAKDRGRRLSRFARLLL